MMIRIMENNHEPRDKKCPVTHLTTDAGAPVVDNQDSMTAGARGPLLTQDLWLNENLETLYVK